uniref:Uncharacterized protein n=1 Tax=Panagrolaimus sp. PS1159 TaxID=55785 RepID=A0AC35GEK9_9BILA
IKITNSTLSLHIATYEKSNEAGHPQFCNKNSDEMTKEKFGSIKKCKKQIFAASKLFIKNLFEFPRQQSDEMPELELSYFKSSQRLINPNKSLYNYRVLKSYLVINIISLLFM